MPETLLLVLALIIAIGVVAILVLLLRPRAAPVDHAAEQQMAELKGHVQALQQSVHQRLDAVTQNLDKSMQTSTKNTTDHLQQLHARLAVIDSAQKNITDLATQVSSLQGILANKQSRGAFGQGRMEAIVADGLPKDAFAFQHTLSLRGASLFLPLKEAPDAAEWVKFKTITFFRSIKEKKQPSFSIFRVECLTLKNSNFFK